MNAGSLLSDGPPTVSPQPEWKRHVDAWRDLLAQCARKPNRKQIHDLRSFTLRLRVVLETDLFKQALEPSAKRALRRWSKEGRKLRRALQPIREADVHLVKLDSLRNAFRVGPDRKSQPSSCYLREIDKLEKWMKQRRQAGIDELGQVIDERGKRLSRLSKGMERALASRMPSTPGSIAQEALRIFTELAGEFTDLNSSNLHAYRKRLKRALYLAETSAATDPIAGQLAAGVRKIHKATGEWHDWQSLALEAGRLLPSHDKQFGLVPVLETQATEALQRALNLCWRSATQLLESVAEIRSLPPRKPVAADPACRQSDEYLSLMKSS